MSMKHYIEKCLAGESLSVDEASDALEFIVSGGATDAQIAGLLIALRAKGETVNEVVGFARMMREKSIKVRVDDPDAIDIVGTGGDGLGTFNISTVASFVAAGAGVTVAKHGNRSVSSQSGSADLLTALGVDIQLSPERVQDSINKLGVGFLFAPLFHPAMKTAARARTELGVRTIFNMVGPITNPASVTRQLVGAYSNTVAGLLAAALRELQAKQSCVVHSDDGMDEVALSGETNVIEVKGYEALRNYALSASQFGLEANTMAGVRGGTREVNAVIAKSVLQGERGPARDVVVANAAMGIYVAGRSRTPREGAEKAAASIDSGRAFAKLKAFVDFSNSP